MKNLIILCLISFWASIVINAQVQVPNGDFENWTDSVTANGWASSITAGIYTVNLISRTTDAYEGNYAAELKSQAIGIYGVLGAQTTIGKLVPDIINLKLDAQGGIPCADKPSKLNGYFKYSPVSGDVMAVFAYLTRYNTAKGNRDTLGSGSYMTNAGISTYTPFSVLISYDTTFSTTPDTLNIVAFASYGSSVGNGTKLWLDKLSLEYGGLNVNEMSKDNNIHIFPVPAKDFIRVLFPSDDIPSEISVVNALGQEFVLPFINENTGITVDVSSLKTGIYYLRLNSKVGILNKSFTVFR